ncbi:MAG TPA: hypothetical protein VKF59_02215 [Candidatus Dormibacteraeota bacterium]|nr:hypothetical protein [Candidatus Dormibacteraeota bacterium]
MARYLLVAHQTAECDELREAAANLAAEDPEAEFVLLVPATPVNSLLVWERGETYEVAVKRAASAGERLRQHGLRVVDARPGDADPLAAVADEIDDGGRYHAIVVSTLPAGVSRWLKMDVPSRLNRNFPRHRVIHVIARPGVATAKA